MKHEFLAGSSPLRRELNDFYRTPEDATIDLLAREYFLGSIWEPACGDGAISEILISRNYDVYSSDLIDRGYGKTGIDFLVSSKTADNIITNPPYELAQEFVEHALNHVTKKVVMLLKLNFLAGQKRKQFFKSTPLKKVYVFSRRLSFDRGNAESKGNGLLEYAWYVWSVKYSGKPTLHWL